MNLGFLTKETAGLPNWAWGLVIVAGGGLGYFFVKKNQASTSSSAAASNAQSQPSATGQSTSGAQGSYGSAIDYSSSLPVSASNPSSPVYVLSGTSGTPPPAPTPSTQMVTARAAASSGPTASFDQSHTGVPIHAGPSWQTPTLSYASFGSQVTLTGPAVQGGSNFPNGWQGGSTTWYPVQGGGFISSYDIVGIGGGGMVRPKKALALPGGN